MFALLYFIASLAFTTVVSEPADAFDVTACNQVVPAREVGILTTDLSCPGSPGFCTDDPGTACDSAADCATGGCRLPVGVMLQNKSTLDLNGHTLGADFIAVDCRSRRCTVAGPGTLTGTSGSLAIRYSKRLAAHDFTVDTGGSGIFSGLQGPLEASNLDVTVGEQVGIRAGKFRGSDITVTGGGEAIVLPAPHPNAGDTLFLPSVEATKLLVAGLSVTASNGDSVSCYGTVKSSDVSVTDGVGHGIEVFRGGLRITGLVATGNGGAGVRSVGRGVEIASGTMTGNGGAYEGVDIATVKFPRLDDATVCGTSGQIDRSTNEIIGSWGVCGGD